MKKLLLLFFGLLPLFLLAQTERGLVAHYLFENNLNDNRGNTDNMGVPLDEPTFSCGINGRSLAFNGGSDEVRFTGQVRQEFNNTEDFTLSLYFKPRSQNGTQYLISKLRTNCELENSFYIRYQPASSTLNVYLRERDGRVINMVESLSSTVCWHHIVLTRDGGIVRLYVDGTFRQEQATIGRIDLLSDADLILGSSECFGQNEVPFNGFIDEMRVYNIALEDNEIRDLYLAPDRILNRDTVIFLGNGVPIEINSNCPSTFTWFPPLGVNPPSVPNPVIQPLNQGDFTYRVRIADAESFCVAEDSIRITVVDPSTLDCSEVFLPNTFTPNDDGLNDTYGISNPFAINLIALEIFDRWGARVFATSDPFRQWDGSFKNKPVMPGVFQYRVRFECNGEEKADFGTLTVMR